MICGLLMSSVRAALMAAAVLTGMAIFVARASSERPARRTESPAPYRVLDVHHTNGEGGGPRLLEVETGQLASFPLPPGLSLQLASLSPWEDRGGRQAVGIGWDRADDHRWNSDVSIVRTKFPEGDVLDRVDLEGSPLPTGAPCWLSGTSAGVLYAGSDGRLYRLDFEAPRRDGDAGPATRPRALTWRVPALADGKVTLGDLSRPADPRLGGKLLVSLYFNLGVRGLGPNWQVWWLELDRDATSVVGAGPLLAPEASDEADGIRRLPTLVHDADGAPALAYLARLGGRTGYQLKVAPIRFDPRSDFPRAREAEARVLARDCLAAALAVSRDGRWITVVRPDGPSIKAERVALGGNPTTITMLP